MIVKFPAGVGDGQGWLVVDDLVDTGRTAAVLRRLLPKAHFAAVYAKPLGRPLVDTFITEVSQDTWIYFPWDVEPQFTQPIASRRKGRSLSGDRSPAPAQPDFAARSAPIISCQPNRARACAAFAQAGGAASKFPVAAVKRLSRRTGTPQ